MPIETGSTYIVNVTVDDVTIYIIFREGLFPYELLGHIVEETNGYEEQLCHT